MNIQGFKSQENQLFLFLDLIFNYQTKQVGESIISFGVTSGTLSLELNNCSTSLTACEVKSRISLPSNCEKNYQVDVSISGNERQNVSWRFQHPTERDTHLQTCLEQEKWVELHIESKPCLITAKFSISELDISIIQPSGLDPIKAKILKQLIVKQLELCKNIEGMHYLRHVEYEYG